ncbi:MAG: helix-turn-helix transcriptional regulator [Lachnospiraceae bacterium]|nr:helix-turn-helix transcriptional regulator [Lachnospiraceae bacterium]
MPRKIVWETPEDINKTIANNLINIRKRKKISQKRLSDMSGVSYGSIKRFETTGEISLSSLTKLAVSLDISDDLKNLFTGISYNNIQEVIDENR